MSKRFKTTNAQALVTHLKNSGLDQDASVGPPSRQMWNGCSDPTCCPQHTGFHQDGGQMLDVHTKVTGSQLHKLAVKMGLVKG